MNLQTDQKQTGHSARNQNNGDGLASKLVAAICHCFAGAFVGLVVGFCVPVIFVDLFRVASGEQAQVILLRMAPVWAIVGGAVGLAFGHWQGRSKQTTAETSHATDASRSTLRSIRAWLVPIPIAYMASGLWLGFMSLGFVNVVIWGAPLGLIGLFDSSVAEPTRHGQFSPLLPKIHIAFWSLLVLCIVLRKRLPRWLLTTLYAGFILTLACTLVGCAIHYTQSGSLIGLLVGPRSRN